LNQPICQRDADILDAIDDALMVVDPQWTLIYANRAAQEFGAPPIGAALPAEALAADAPPDPTQLPLFAEARPHPALEALRAMDVSSMTPLEALNRLAGVQGEGGEGWVAWPTHPPDDEGGAGIAEPWNAVGSPEAGTFMAYFPCESGGRNIRYVLRAPGRWFTVVAEFPLDQYDRMVGWMRENETSEAADYTVDDPIRATLAIQENYVGWSTVDRAE